MPFLKSQKGFLGNLIRKRKKRVLRQRRLTVRDLLPWTESENDPEFHNSSSDSDSSWYEGDSRWDDYTERYRILSTEPESSSEEEYFADEWDSPGGRRDGAQREAQWEAHRNSQRTARRQIAGRRYARRQTRRKAQFAARLARRDARRPPGSAQRDAAAAGNEQISEVLHKQESRVHHPFDVDDDDDSSSGSNDSLSGSDEFDDGVFSGSDDDGSSHRDSDDDLSYMEEDLSVEDLV